jgi:hypothetical protein
MLSGVDTARHASRDPCTVLARVWALPLRFAPLLKSKCMREGDGDFPFSDFPIRFVSPWARKSSRRPNSLRRLGLRGAVVDVDTDLGDTVLGGGDLIKGTEPNVIVLCSMAVARGCRFCEIHSHLHMGLVTWTGVKILPAHGAGTKSLGRV